MAKPTAPNTTLVEAPGEAATPDKIAVLFIHGVEIPDPNYADYAIRMLRDEYAGATDNAQAPTLEIEAAYWIPVIAEGLDKVAQQTFGNGFSKWTGRLNQIVHLVNNGSFLAMLPLVASGLLRRVPWLPNANWPTLRWAFTYFVGDLVAYQVAQGNDDNYKAIHGCIDDALAKLAERAPDAPLCVISHSLGTVIASDHFYDLQQGKPAPLTSVQCGENLAFLYTLGSPIALWMVRYPTLDRPIRLPGRDHGTQRIRDAAEWVNYYDPDDIVGYPLRTLSPEYEHAVDRDEPVRLGPPILGSTPVSHVAYFNSRRIIRPIAEHLALLAGPKPTGPKKSRRPSAHPTLTPRTSR